MLVKDDLNTWTKTLNTWTKTHSTNREYSTRNTSVDRAAGVITMWLLRIFRMKWRRDASQSNETLKSNSVEDNGHEKAHVWNLGKPRKQKAFSYVEHNNFITTHLIKWNVVYLRLGLGFHSNEIGKPKQPKKKLSELSRGPWNSTHTYVIVSMSQTQTTLESGVLSPLRWSCELETVSKIVRSLKKRKAVTWAQHGSCACLVTGS